MKGITFFETSISDLVSITPIFAVDTRGEIMKSYEKSAFTAYGIDFAPYEQLFSFSRKGVIRGLHFQRDYGQAKLVHALSGTVYDVAVDLRRGSPTFGKWEGFTLSAENHRALYIPKGFAHGFLALEDALLCYLLDDRFDPSSADGILWNDPQLAISWPVAEVGSVILSEKDRLLPTFSKFSAAYGGLEA